ncbi:HWE histidine kinase domain-containing protein [Devosia sp.]|uniref:sensor histidine kinase n=1 Tax=Devosia sp. TaxID=1871048 RepID=UPI00262EB094|nr:HWE histidine kinase domain-containing protein [Devosia sp.]
MNIAAKLSLAVEAMSPAVWVWEAASRQFLASASLAALYGKGAALDLEEFLECTHPGDRPVWQQVFEGTGDGDPPKRILYRVGNGSLGSYRWLSADITASSDASGGRTLVGVVHDASAEHEAHRALVESDERLRLAMEAGKMAVWDVDLQSGSLTPSRQLNVLLGLPLTAEPSVVDVRKLYAPGEFERLQSEGVTYERLRDREVQGGDGARRDWAAFPEPSRTHLQAEFRLITPAGESKTLVLRGQYVRPFDGGGTRLTGMLIDVTERKIIEDRLALSVGELQHRLKNHLMITGAIATQTFRAGADINAALEAFNGRLRALGTATELMLQASSSNPSLPALMNNVLAPFRATEVDRFELSGEDVPIPAPLVSGVTMVVHELATNAVKYGGLSVPAGRVSLTWESRGGLLQICWRETGGPMVVAPTRRGFGSRLISGAVPGGTIEVDYAPSGVVCRISVPRGEA